MSPRRVTVHEVGLRDGLQNEAQHVATADKLRLLRILADAGFPAIERRASSRRAGSLRWPTRPRWWPRRPRARGSAT